MKVRTWGLIILIGVVGLMSTGCKYAWVRRDLLDRQKAQIQELKNANADLQSRLKAQVALNVELTKANDELKEIIKKGGGAVSDLQKTLDAQREIMKSLQTELDKKKAENAAFEKTVIDLRKRVAEAERLTAASGKRGLLLNLSSDLAFGAGKADLKDAAKKALDEVVGQLKGFPGEIEIAGHTDSQPIKYSAYGTNLNLSGARAMAVLNYLAEKGVSEKQMHFAGYGDHQLVMKDGKENQAASRRVEIILLSSAGAMSDLNVKGLESAAGLGTGTGTGANTGKLKPEETPGKLGPEVKPAPEKPAGKLPPMK